MSCRDKVGFKTTVSVLKMNWNFFFRCMCDVPAQFAGQECRCTQISGEWLVFHCWWSWPWSCWLSLWWRYWYPCCCWHWRRACCARPPWCHPDASPLNLDLPSATLDASWGQSRPRFEWMALTGILTNHQMNENQRASIFMIQHYISTLYFTILNPSLSNNTGMKTWTSQNSISAVALKHNLTFIFTHWQALISKTTSAFKLYIWLEFAFFAVNTMHNQLSYWGKNLHHL